jgi:hypothetical protein
MSDLVDRLREAAEEAKSAMNTLKDCRALLAQLSDEGIDLSAFTETAEALQGEAADLGWSAKALYRTLREVD